MLGLARVRPALQARLAATVCDRATRSNIRRRGEARHDDLRNDNEHAHHDGVWNGAVIGVILSKIGPRDISKNI